MRLKGRTFLGSLLPVCLLLAGCSSIGDVKPLPIAPSARYVAMGSSFAAGPGITESADSPATRCGRSRDNYARQLARLRQLDLVDVSCGGATTAHILGPWDELPAQLGALTPDTALVTITIGGNDVGFIRALFEGSCRDDSGASAFPQTAAMCKAVAARRPDPASPEQAEKPGAEAAWARLAANLDRIGAEVRRRAPRARLIYVDYIRVVPSQALCPEVPLGYADATAARAMVARLEQVTAAAARRAGADVLSASALSRAHDACAAEPWATGLVPRQGDRPSTPYHPNLGAMTAIASALDRMLGH